MDDFEGSEADFVANLINTPISQVSELAIKGFKPWHKPRKHWIREHQWAKNCRELMQQFTADRHNETSQDLSLLDTGVAELVLSPHVSQVSTVVRDRLQSLANRESVSNERLKEFGDFDAVNIDLCNSMIQAVGKTDQQTYYDALHALFEHQKASRTKPFLLFVTTRTHRKTLDEDSLSKLVVPLDRNLKNSDFSRKIETGIGIQCNQVGSLISQQAIPSQWTQRMVSQTVAIAISKWLLALLWNGHPRWKITLKDSFEYEVLEERDMLSVTFLCEPVQVSSNDLSKLSNYVLNKPSSQLSEVELALLLLKGLLETQDLDEKLRKEVNTYQETVAAAADLMASAGYSRGDYIKTYS
jgi:hypothetical protein